MFLSAQHLFLPLLEVQPDFLFGDQFLPHPLLLHMKELNALASRLRLEPVIDLGLVRIWAWPISVFHSLLSLAEVSHDGYVTQARLIRATWKKKPAPITVRI